MLDKQTLAKQKIYDWLLVRLSEELDIAVEDIDPDMALMKMGLSSAKAIVLVQELEKFLGVTLKPVVLFNNPNINSLSIFLSTQVGENLATEKSQDIMNVIANDVLVSEKNTTIKRDSVNKFNEDVLLTGADGLLGCNLLYQLLCQGNGKIYCLVRERDGYSANDKFRRALQANSIDIAGKEDRVIVVPGELTKKNLGINDSIYDEISNNVGIIIHNAARVNHVYEYIQLRAENVNCIDEILLLAKQGRNKEIHFISTIMTASYLDSSQNNGTEMIHNKLIQNVSSGYCLSKICAEIKLHNAILNNYDVNIYRPCQILRMSYRTINEVIYDEFLSFMTGCMQLGVFPKTDLELNFLPVNVVAKVIVHILLSGKKFGEAYNIFNTNKIRLPELILKFPEVFNVKSVSIEDFINKYVPIIDNKNNLNLFKSNLTLKGLFDYLEQSRNSKITQENTLLALGDVKENLIYSEDRFVQILQQILNLSTKALIDHK